MTTEPLRIAIAGLGTVGAGVVKILQAHGDVIAARAGRAIEITSVHARDKSKNRGIDLSKYDWADNADGLIAGADVVVELIGGEDGAAKELVEAALRSGKHVVTANKALLAKHGFSLARLAEENGVSLNFEAAVAGGIPIIKSLREGLAANKISGVYGILNGTCNYIMTEMRETGRDFADVLAEAQSKGYAEADPSFDVDGIDAAHKLSILTSLAFGVRPDFDAIDISGIRNVTAQDIAYADELGCKIKLLGIAREIDGRIAQTVEPCLVPVESPLGGVEGVFNAVYLDGDFVGKTMLEGRGAGEGPTASAVLADIIDIARGVKIAPLGVPAKKLKIAGRAIDSDIVSGQYIHLVVPDRAGVIADVSAVLRDFNISIESIIQRGRDPGQPVSVVITTHECTREAIRKAAERLDALDCVSQKPTILRIERF